ncbi:hypothetical protein F5Y17DRAFT_299184 [Xylariaceae sp. FL0594]|nr:hypothetical protein F5Y17DRAFT_299184 [Xylariaceae sp. FL0594]
MTDISGSPPLLRPVPVRPQKVNLAAQEATPSSADKAFLPHTPDLNSSVKMEWLNLRLLDRRNLTRSDDSNNSISRAQSVKDLTAPALLGIYNSAHVDSDRLDASTNALGTPWGAGAETPAIETMNSGKALRAMDRQSGFIPRRRSSVTTPAHASPSPFRSTVFYGGLRALLLSTLGIVYGIGVASVRSSQSTADNRILRLSALEWEYLAFWGAAGLILGSLLPWFDGYCEKTPEQTSDGHPGDVDNLADKDTQRYTDWSLVVRGIGIFIGIAYAIRKLPWDSTFQVAMSLALVNPALWYLIDRSMSGFFVSSAVGIAGSAVFAGIQPAMVPVPAVLSSSSSDTGLYGASAAHGNSSVTFSDGRSMFLGGLASPQTVATGIWRLNVLFCCCVVIGNVGRWLAMNKPNARRL